MKTIFSIKILFFSFLIFAYTSVFAVSVSNPIEVISDTAITAVLLGKITVDKSDYPDVTISTINGVVYLQGTVDTDNQASNLVALASSTSGVKMVDTSKLKIRQSKSPVDDMVITGKVKGLFIKNKLFNEKDIDVMSIHVETTNGVVYLSGTANNSEQAKNAVKLARSVDNVVKVESSIAVVKS